MSYHCLVFWIVPNKTQIKLIFASSIIVGVEIFLAIDTNGSRNGCRGCTICRHYESTSAIFRSILRQSRPNKAGLKCPSMNLYVHKYVCQSSKSFFDFDEIWRIGRVP